ncbi:MAG: Ig-like domain-containing protein [Myxococcota bacterium]
MAMALAVGPAALGACTAATDLDEELSGGTSSPIDESENQELHAEPPNPEPQLDDVGLGIGGFALDGETSYDYAARAFTPVGDVNGDGIDDFAVGAHGNDEGGSSAGHTYVVFGQNSFPAGPLDLGAVGGSVPGISFMGSTGDVSGYAIGGGGDFNGDGLADLIVGARGHNGSRGSTYVIYGHPQLGGSDVPLYAVELMYGTGNASGLVFRGESSSDSSGFSVANAGDVNGDGLDDLLIGAPYADPNGSASGRTYVVFGGQHSPIAAWVDLDTVAQGNGGVAIDGENGSDYSGYTVDGAGDVNGDGFADVLIGAPWADPNGNSSGRTYVVYGAEDFGTGPISLADVAAGLGGFALDGENAYDYAGRGLSRAGDVDGDGRSDILVGAPGYDGPSSASGRSYIVLGQETVAASPIALADIVSGAGGIVLDGISGNNDTGRSVDALGDLNGDGLDDVLVSADRRGPVSEPLAGTSMVVFGGDDPGLTTEPGILASVDGAWEGGFTLEGENAGDRASYALSGIGDVNGDGVPDIGVGAPYADQAGTNAGRAYVAFGDPAQGSYHVGYSRSPRAVADEYVVAQGSTLAMGGPGLLANDFDADGDGFLAVRTKFTTPAGSNVRIDIDGAMSFTPPSDQWWGRDSFEYTIEDDTGRSGVGRVDVVVSPTAISLELVATGHGGFALDGAEPFDGAAQALCGAGDIDQDGYDDLLLGAFEADSPLTSAGQSYVFYGEASTTSPIELAMAATGFSGESAFDWSGIAVSPAGDFNGDDVDDFLIGALGSDTNGNRSGRSYLVFGDSLRPSDPLATLDGNNGIIFDGAAAEDDSGRTVASVGDVNGDGFDDIAIAAYRADVSEEDEGRVYIVYGTDTGLGPLPVQLSDVGVSVPGFVIEGESAGDFAGFAVSGAADFDGDGYDDIVVGAYDALQTVWGSGRAYVIYGGPAIPSLVSLVDVADPTTVPDLGIAIDGDPDVMSTARSVQVAGDVDGDGRPDLLIGAPAADFSASGSGRVYLISGGAALEPGAPTIALADVGSTVEGVTFDGEAELDGAGASLIALGDVNADGFDDFAIGAPLASSATMFASGRGYVVLGRPDFDLTPSVALEDIAAGVGGFALDGEISFDSAGHSVGAAGDVNRDGYPDIVIGAFNGGPAAEGRAYVIYGGDFIQTPASTL